MENKDIINEISVIKKELQCYSESNVNLSNRIGDCISAIDNLRTEIRKLKHLVINSSGISTDVIDLADKFKDIRQKMQSIWED